MYLLFLYTEEKARKNARRNYIKILLVVISRHWDYE